MSLPRLILELCNHCRLIQTREPNTSEVFRNCGKLVQKKKKQANVKTYTWHRRKTVASNQQVHLNSLVLEHSNKCTQALDWTFEPTNGSWKK